MDREFWTDRQRVSRIPIARREKTFIIGPGAAEMTARMLQQMFDEVETARILERVEDRERFDYVIRLVHDSFDSRTLFLPLLTKRRYEVGVGAEVSSGDGSRVGRVGGTGADSFWLVGLSPENRLEGDERIRAKASVTLNAAVQDALFELMEALDETLPPPVAREP